ncbi:MAG: hypothetical protein JWM32_3131 [Verrucomicrobia bacterium]|nr:hypothetical protein [Verrucomicrobiota bacterium]
MTLTSLRFGKAFRASFAALLCVLLTALTLHAATTEKKTFSVPSGTAFETLKDFTAQSGDQLLYSGDDIAAVRTNAVNGSYTAAEALSRMFAGTGLTVVQNKKDGSLSLRKESPAEAKNDSSRPAGSRTARNEDGVLKLDTFEVMDSKLLNMDIKRSVDDPQPYVIFDHAKIERSGAINIEDFLRQRLAMNLPNSSNSQAGFSGGDTSAINLRGLGANQTLILIDGRRTARTSSGFSLGQADLNGIPLAAIERIEVLPTTASAIYGGEATGGVINVILRRDYAGAELKLTYDNSFDTDSAIRRADFSAGYTTENGKTNLLLAATYSSSNDLLTRDRDFMTKGRSILLANNPAALQPGSSVPLGTTANIRSANGTILVLKNGQSLNSTFTSSPGGYPGAATDQGVALVANAGRYNLGLSPDAAAFGGGGNTLLNSPVIKSISGSARHRLNDIVQVFAEASHSENLGYQQTNQFASAVTVPISAPTNPFQQAIQVRVANSSLNGTATSKSAYDRVAAGVILKLPADWMLGSDFTWTRAAISYQLPQAVNGAFVNAVGNGTVDLLRDPATQPQDFTSYYAGPAAVVPPLRSTMKDYAVRASGPVGKFERSPRLSFLLERRDADFEQAIETLYSSTGVTGILFPDRTQTVQSAYAEMRVPVFSKVNAQLGAQRLDLQFAVRWDDYASHNATNVIYSPPAAPVLAPGARNQSQFTSVNPLIALSYEPIRGVTLRASYGKGFLPPELNQVGVPNAPTASTSPFVDPKRGNTGPVATYQLTTGGNAALQPEHSTSTSAGIILQPALVPTLRLSVDYTRIKKHDNIQTLSLQQILDNESLFASRVTRGPNLPGDQPGWAGPITAIDDTLLNVATAEVDAIDVQTDATISLHEYGTLEFFAAGSWELRYKTQLVPTVAAVNLLGIRTADSIPLRFKSNVGVTWTRGHLSFGWTARYFSSFFVADPTLASSATAILNQGNGGRIPAEIYHDVFARYAFSRSTDSQTATWLLLRDVDVQLGVRNVFNREPPFDSRTSLTYYAALGDARLASYYISVTKHF